MTQRVKARRHARIQARRNPGTQYYVVRTREGRTVVLSASQLRAARGIDPEWPKMLEPHYVQPRRAGG